MDECTVSFFPLPVEFPISLFAYYFLSGDLEDAKIKAEYKRGYEVAGEFFNKYL